MGCGPVSGSVIVAIKLRSDDKSQWLNVAEMDGFIEPFLMDEDVFDELMKEDFENKEFYENLESYRIEEVDGFSLDGDFGDLCERTTEDPENPAAKLIRFLLLLIENADENDEILKMGVGKYTDELDLPIT